MNKENTTKTVYQVWRNVPAWSNDREIEPIVFKECYTLLDAGFYLGKLATIGVTAWLQVKEENRS